MEHREYVLIYDASVHVSSNSFASLIEPMYIDSFSLLGRICYMN